MSLTLTVTTFWKSCDDATHFYGEVKDENGRSVTPRSLSRRRPSRDAVVIAFETWANLYQAHEETVVMPETEHR